MTVEQGIRIYVPGVEGESSDSDEQFISLARAEAPTGVGRIGQTAAASGALTGVDSSMEYKAADADEWTGAEGETAEGLAPGYYRVRYAGTDTQAPSVAVAVSILDFEAPERNETPEAEFDASSMTLSPDRPTPWTAARPGMTPGATRSNCAKRT